MVIDAPRDAFACKPIGGAGGSLEVPFVVAPKIDGDLADWPACFVSIDATHNPTRDLDHMGAFASGRFSLAHDATKIYLAADITGIAPLGDEAVPGIFENDSVSFYLDGDGVFTSQAYDSDAMQLVIDHANRVQGFRDGMNVTATSVTSAAITSGNHYTIEASVAPSTFGLTAFGASIGFDLGIENGDGASQLSEVLWYQACELPLCGCMSGTESAPYCDAREFGTATLSGP